MALEHVDESNAEPDPAWPEPDDDGWVWLLVDFTCPACGEVQKIHKQRPEALKRQQGVKVECSKCEVVTQLGGYPKPVAYDEVLECGDCHSTFDGRENPDPEGDPLKFVVERAEDGSWTCKVCGNHNQYAVGADAGTVSSEVAP